MSKDNGEYTSGSEEEDVEYPEFDFVGGMKARWMWDAASRQLSVALRQVLQTNRRVEFKCKGHLSATTGTFNFKGHLRKNFLTNLPSIQNVQLAAEERKRGQTPSNPDIDPDAFLPGGLKALLWQDWAISPGLSYDSSKASPMRYAVAVRKAPQVLLHSPRFDLFVTAKALAEVEPKNAEVSASTGVRLKLNKYALTDSQDLRVSVGFDVDTVVGRSLVPSPYLKVAENSCSVQLQRGRWTFMYEL